MLRNIILSLTITAIFMLGWLSANLYNNLSITDAEKPLSIGSLFTGSVERYSPADHVKEKNIHVYSDKVVLDLAGATWSSFTDTNSMDPLIDAGANGIEIKPKSTDELKKGDIIAFRTPYASGIIIHRIAETGSDDNGWYAKTKGDNNPTVDPGKVRFKDITGVVVGVIY